MESNDKYRLDSGKIQYHPERVARLLDGIDDWEKAKEIYPIYIEISPAGGCNARCTFCAVSYLGYKTNFLDPHMLHDRFQEMGVLGVKSVMLAGEGEPTLHKNINDIAQSAVESGIDVAFTTNGVLLDRLFLRNVSWVKVSLNAATRETYSKIHRVSPHDFDKAVKNLRGAVKRKGDCVIGAQMVLLPENAHEVDAFKALADDIGLDYAVAKPYSQHKLALEHTRQYEHFDPKTINIVPSEKLVVRERAMNNKEMPYHKCLATPFIWAYLMATGDLYSCSAYLSDERFNLGNLNTTSFKEVWQGERRKANWELVRKTLDINECRVNCRQNQSNIYLTDLVNGIPHQNFI